VSRRFVRRSVEEEAKILFGDDLYLTSTRAYLDDLILDTLDVFELSPSQKERLQTNLHQVIPRAARAYRANNRHLIGTHFSLYSLVWMVNYLKKNVRGLKKKGL